MSWWLIVVLVWAVAVVAFTFGWVMRVRICEASYPFPEMHSLIKESFEHDRLGL